MQIKRTTLSSQKFFEEIKFSPDPDKQLKQSVKNKLQQRQDFFLEQKPVEIILKQHLLEPLDLIQ